MQIPIIPLQRTFKQKIMQNSSYRKITAYAMFIVLMLSLQLGLKRNLDGDIEVSGFKSASVFGQGPFSQPTAQVCFLGPFLGTQITCPIGFQECATTGCEKLPEF